MQSGYDINHLAQEAQTRWLKPAEVFFILQNYEEHQLTHQNPQKPASGSLYLFNKRVLKSFRKDGHNWRRRRDQRTIAEAHERLKVGNVEALNCYYAHGEETPNFQRRSYWILDRKYEHIVLVHYRDIGEGRLNARSTSQSSPLSFSTFVPSSISFATNQQESSFHTGESYEVYHNQSSPSSVEITSSEVIKKHGMNHLDIGGEKAEVNSSSVPDLSLALRRIEHQLSLNDDDVKDFDAPYTEYDDSTDLEDALREYDLSGRTSNGSDNFLSQQNSDDWIQQYHQVPGVEVDIWKDMQDRSSDFAKAPSEAQLLRDDAQNSFQFNPQDVDSIEFSAYPSHLNAYGMNQDSYSSLFDQAEMGISFDNNVSLTMAQKQKFTIQEISPEWCYTSEGAKIIIIGSFLCDPSECAWACMFGDTEVPVEIIQEGVIRCHAPPHLQGKVSLCLTSGNRKPCSEVKNFDYRTNLSVCTLNSPPETKNCKSSEELLLLVRLVQTLLSDLLPKGHDPETRTGFMGKSRMAEDPWSQLTDTLLFGTSTSSDTLDWLLQELLKDKLEVWLSSKSNQNGCSLSKKEQGLIHVIAGLGFEWALQPILNSGVSIDFRDINGWTALHWAARFGREKMVAALIASGASAGAVTDPNSQDPRGKTPASIAATSGNGGLAGYLSELELTTHLSSLQLKESEISKGSAAAEAERTVNSVSKAGSSRNDDQASLKDTLAAVRNAAQAAARIQSAFRAHSFRKRQQREAAADDSGDEYSIFTSDIQGLSAASKLAFGNARDFNTAALSIQKKYRGWKGRKDFLTLRQKVVKIQAHVRGYQVRKNYKVCWAVGILEKVVLRWRRRGAGLRGFRPDPESIDESEDDDILKVFRKQKVDTAIAEAVSRVLSMVESPKARQQYQRILQKFHQAKADLQNADSDMTSSYHDNFSHPGTAHTEEIE